MNPPTPSGWNPGRALLGLLFSLMLVALVVVPVALSGASFAICWFAGWTTLLLVMVFGTASGD